MYSSATCFPTDTISGLRATYEGTYSDTQSIVPRLNFKIKIDYIRGVGGQPPDLWVSYASSKLNIIPKAGDPVYVSLLVHEPSLLHLFLGNSVEINFYGELDHFKLAQLEKIREGGDLQIRIDLYFIVQLLSQPAFLELKSCSINARIPKSDWVEKILPSLKFKDVSLIEIPKIENPEFGQVIDEINEAWKQYSMGEYKNVLVECRKAMEALGDVVKSKNFKKETPNEKGEKKTEPDWAQALQDEEIGNIIGSFVQKLSGFLAPAAHHGKSFNREEAELAILITHALTKYVASKLVM